MQKYINLQRDVQDKIVKAHVNFKKSSKERLASEAYIITRLEVLNELWARFTKVHEDIVTSVDDWSELESNTYVTTGIYDSTEESYINYKSDILRYQRQLVPQSRAESTGNGGGVTSILKLPRITIPAFSGKYEEWITFRDMFVSLIHTNASLDDVQRLHYLKGYLTGEAEQLIRQLPITAENYMECWSQLKARFDNKNYLANCILKRLMNQKEATKESSVLLKDLVDTTSDCLHALKNIGIDVASWDILVIYIVANKLDAETRKQWELKVADGNGNELPKFCQFREFLQSRFKALEFIEPDQGPKPSTLIGSKFQRPKVLHVVNAVCEYCTEDHKIYTCKKFMNQNVDKRREFVVNHRLCYNCLGSNHLARFCPCKTACRVCNGKHHSILHLSGTGYGRSHQAHTGTSKSEVGSSAETSAVSSESMEAAPVVACFGQVPVKKQVLLATAVVWAEAPRGQKQYIRALLDQGSQASFVSEATVEYLGIKKYAVRGVISGLEGNNNTVSRYMVNLKIRSRINNKVVIDVQAYVLKSITTFLPNWKVEKFNWLDKGLCLADPQYNIPNKIDMLLGADIYGQIIQDGVRKCPQGSLLMQSTSLGWILSGLYPSDDASSTKVVSMHVCVEENETQKRFWEIEVEPQSKKNIMTEEGTRCEQFSGESTKRDLEGRYVVRLPFQSKRRKYVDVDSKTVAEKRFKGLVVDGELEEISKKEMEEYLHLGYMEKVPVAEINSKTAVYPPHHAVARNDKDTTKINVVYHASCKCQTGVLLNGCLMVGPTLEPELRHLVMRWRQQPICLSANIVKMYCQVKYVEHDTNYQTLLERKNGEAEIEDNEVLRVTFGTAASLYLPVKNLLQTAHDDGASFSAASERREGIAVYHETTQLFRKGEFEFKKWISNGYKLLQAIKDSSKDDTREELKLKTDEAIKVMGLIWNRSTDEFRYSVTLPPDSGPETKRKIISHISRLYDPLGRIALCVTVAKNIVQKLWISGLGWDEEVTAELLKEFDTYREGLSNLTQVSILRRQHTKRSNSLVELLGFCGAEGEVSVNWVRAKTKVAPIKLISIPRQVLCGAVLVSRLLLDVTETLSKESARYGARSNATVILAWLNCHPSHWPMFDTNRMSDILTPQYVEQWSQEHNKEYLHRFKWAYQNPKPGIGDIV